MSAPARAKFFFIFIQETGPIIHLPLRNILGVRRTHRTFACVNLHTRRLYRKSAQIYEFVTWKEMRSHGTCRRRGKKPYSTNGDTGKPAVRAQLKQGQNLPQPWWHSAQVSAPIATWGWAQGPSPDSRHKYANNSDDKGGENSAFVPQQDT